MTRSGPKLYTLDDHMINRILSRRKSRNEEIKMQSSFRPAKLERDDGIYCYRCNLKLKIGDKVVSRITGNASSYTRRRLYHKTCARAVNII